MQRLMLISSLLAIVLQTFSLPFLAFRLESKRESEAIPMCVNRDQPELACFGSCYINRHLTAAMDQDMAQNDASIITNLQAQPLVSADFSFLDLFLVVPAQQDRCFSFSDWHASILTKGIWHPPRA
jgi:hypothetical protein